MRKLHGDRLLDIGVIHGDGMTTAWQVYHERRGSKPMSTAAGKPSIRAITCHALGGY
ncbi:hypothetical protein BN2476_1240008 [Paraburkholderia piptadeniae]|uniref:Uncharacterized protein n=1 Tax=Paraburkholderia piptadeniae TaxID=1701573 RepID=A0A1N7SW16_9BURK|nr:hypothetical protein BN2476_1240008 [Paraburkholderia piptadeniae]